MIQFCVSLIITAMMDFLKNLFGVGPAVDYAALSKNGAQIVDVRSEGEYRSGHIKGSINLPLDRLPQLASKLIKDKPIITCCASGMRSGSAKSWLLSNGFIEVYNGGGWAGLEDKLK
jgi:rhodanese-related sulfurtransferase